MIKEFATLSLVLLVGLVSWCAYERTTWDEDYTRYPITIAHVGTLDNTYQQHIDPTYFKRATVITNDTHLRFPEDIAVNSQGVIYTGLCDGSIVTVTPESNNTELVYQGDKTGRVYGLILTEDESTLFFLTEFKGLVRYDLVKREAHYLLSESILKQTGALNSVCIDQKQQTLYITESGPVRMSFSAKEIILGHSKGKIYSYDLKTGDIHILMDQLAFPNGIVFHKQSNSLIFAELNRYKIWRYNLGNGVKEILVQNLFGFPDNLKVNDKGELLVGIPSTRSAFTEKLLANSLARKLALFLPERLSYALNPKRAGGIKIDTNTGRILEYMFGAPTKTSFVTTILEKKGKTYFASLRSPTILVLEGPRAEGAEKGPEKETEM